MKIKVFNILILGFCCSWLSLVLTDHRYFVSAALRKGDEICVSGGKEMVESKRHSGDDVRRRRLRGRVEGKAPTMAEC